MKPDIKQRIEQIRRGEVPDGYKKTKAGIMPEEWEVKKLKTICDVNPVRSNNIVDKVVFLGMSDVSEDGKILNQEIVDYESVKKGFTPFQKGDILVAKITPCFENGKGAYTEALMTDIGFGSTEFHVLRCKNNAKFIFFHTMYSIFRKKMESEMTGSAGQKRIQTESIANYVIPFPPLPEQQKIAAILTTQDRVIELKQQLLAQKQQQKKYLMQQLLTGKKRLPGFNGEWKDKILKQILSPGNKIPVDDTSKYKKITVKLNFKGLDYLKLNREMADTRPFYIRKKNEIIIGKQNYFNGSIALIDKQFDGCICSNAIMSFSVREANPYFVLKFLSQNDFLKKHQMLANGTGQKELSESDFLEFHILLPPLKEQTAIANILSAADREIDLIRQNIEQEKQKKKALMQLLLTGIVRVTV